MEAPTQSMLATKVLAMTDSAPAWESHWYALYTHILVDATAPLGDTIVSPQHTLDRTVSSGSRGREIVTCVIPDFVTLKTAGNVYDHASDMVVRPTMVSEGKKERSATPEVISYQCWKQVSYCFEKYPGIRRMSVFAWEGSEWRIYVVRRAHRMNLSVNTDPGYNDQEELDLPESLTIPVVSGSIASFEDLDHVIAMVNRHLRS